MAIPVRSNFDQRPSANWKKNTEEDFIRFFVSLSELYSRNHADKLCFKNYTPAPKGPKRQDFVNLIVYYFFFSMSWVKTKWILSLTFHEIYVKACEESNLKM